VPVTVTLERRKQHRYSVGLGYGTDTGPRGTLGWENRHINPRGHRARAGLELSSLRTQITAAYEVPLSRPLTDWLVFQAALTDENTDTANSTSQTLSAQRVKSRGNDWLETLSFNFLHEDFEVGGETGTTTLVYPAANWTRVRADDRVYPRRGHRISVDLKGTDPALGSDTRLIQVRADGKLVQALGKRGRALLRGSLGGTWVGDFNALPASMRFFAGGDQSVRGYGYNTLGPRNALDQVRGGHFLVVGSAEYDYRFADKWSGAVFYDVGNAIDHFTDDLKQGLGFGVRWRSPVGPIRVDLAAGLNDPDSPVRLHFTMGPDL
jgi:translocation and assembly module TamA